MTQDKRNINRVSNNYDYYEYYECYKCHRKFPNCATYYMFDGYKIFCEKCGKKEHIYHILKI
jgi:hypothetical protein